MAENYLVDLKKTINSRREILKPYEKVFRENETPDVTSKSYEGVQSKCRDALDSNPWDAEALQYLGESAAAHHDYEVAIYSLEEARALGKTSDKLTKVLGLTYYHYGKYLERNEEYLAALDNLKKAEETFEGYDPGKDIKLAEIIKHLDTEITVIKTESGKSFRDLEKRAGQSDELAKQDQGQVDVKGLEKILNSPNAEPTQRLDAGKRLGRYYEIRGNYDKAIEYLEQVRDLDQKSDTKRAITDVKYKKAAQEKDENLLRVVMHEYSALVEETGNPEIALSLGEVNFSLGEWWKCIQVLQDYPSTKKEDRNQGGLRIAESLIRIEEYLAAELQAKEIAEEIERKHDKDYIAAMYLLGVAQLKQGKNEEAKKSLSEVIRHNIFYRDTRDLLTNIQKNTIPPK